jgi:bifunctional UDP-N-acetylglucosamine pyrophosphorylase/glucosamine-1-phosphate N-acetyltransferase
MQELTTIILASSKGADMKSAKPLYTHEICGQAMISYVTEVGLRAGSGSLVVALNNSNYDIESLLPDSSIIVNQGEAESVGNALSLLRSDIEKNIDGTVLLLPGNCPAIKDETIKAAYDFHIAKENMVTVFSTPEGSLSDICFINTKAILKLFDSEFIGEDINELYTSDILKIYFKKGLKLFNYITSQPEELIVVNNRQSLCEAEQVIQTRIINRHMENGVTFHFPATCMIHPKAKIGMDTEIYQGTVIKGETQIGTGCTIGPNTMIEESILGNNVSALNAVILQSQVGDSTNIGPFAYIRPGSKIGDHIKIGDFVEIKNSVIGDNSKVPHLSYIGDSDIGKGVNIGCGSITVNYDGRQKHRTVVEDDAFIGCNVNLVSPVVVKHNAFVGAGSTITKEVPEYSLAIARSSQTIIADWVRKKGLDKK